MSNIAVNGIHAFYKLEGKGVFAVQIGGGNEDMLQTLLSLLAMLEQAEK